MSNYTVIKDAPIITWIPLKITNYYKVKLFTLSMYQYTK